MDINILSEELEKIYTNKCDCDMKDKKGERICLGLDEQELAIIHMCMDILENRTGYNKEDYKVDEMFILLKNSPICKYRCTGEKVAKQPLKMMELRKDPSYCFESTTNVLFTFYALILKYANCQGTHNYKDKSIREYFKIYAYFACICPKVFVTLFLNQINIFMKRIYVEDDKNKISNYVKDTKTLWEEYVYLFSEKGNKLIFGEIISQYGKVVNRDHICDLINIEEMHTTGFLAFDYKGRSPVESAMLVKAIKGIIYFQHFLNLFKNEQLKYLKSEDEVIEDIESLYGLTKELYKQIKLFIDESGTDYRKPDIAAFNIEELLERFKRFCECNSVILLDV